MTLWRSARRKGVLSIGGNHERSAPSCAHRSIVPLNRQYTEVVVGFNAGHQSGMSRQLFEDWCEDRRNGVIIADFAVQGTLAREILGSPAEVMTRAGIKVSVVWDADSALWESCPVPSCSIPAAGCDTLRLPACA